MTAPYVPPYLWGVGATPESKPVPAVVAEAPKAQSDLPLLLASLPSLAAAIYDAETTFSGIGRGAGMEANPIMRPLVNAGRVPTYAALAALTAGQALGSKYLRDRGSKWWWAPQALTAIGHLVAGRLNQSRGGK